MDIMRPSIEQQVAPAPWMVTRSVEDVPTLIKEAVRRRPSASVDDIVGQLAARGVQVSGIIVAMWMRKLDERTESRAAVLDQAFKEARPGFAVDAKMNENMWKNTIEVYRTGGAITTNISPAEGPYWTNKYLVDVPKR